MRHRSHSAIPFAAFAAAIFAATLFAVSAAHANAPAAAPPAATAAAESPAPASPAAPPVAAEKPAARREDTEPQTLTEAKTLLKTARSERDDAEAEVLDANAALERTKQLLSTTLETCKAAQKERDETKALLGTAAKERDDERTSHGKTKELLVLAEAAAGVLGVDPKNAVPAASQSSSAGSQGERLYAQWQALRQTDTSKAQSFYREHKEALEAYADSQRSA